MAFVTELPTSKAHSQPRNLEVQLLAGFYLKGRVKQRAFTVTCAQTHVQHAHAHTHTCTHKELHAHAHNASKDAHSHASA